MNQINWKGLGEEFGLIIVRGCNKCVEISQWISRTVCVNNWKWFLTNGSPYWSMLIVWFAAPNWKMWNNCASVKSVPVKGAVSLIKRKFVIDDSVRRMKKEGKSKREKERKRKKRKKKKDTTFCCDIQTVLNPKGIKSGALPSQSFSRRFTLMKNKILALTVSITFFQRIWLFHGLHRPRDLNKGWISLSPLQSKRFRLQVTNKTTFPIDIFRRCH